MVKLSRREFIAVTAGAAIIIGAGIYFWSISQQPTQPTQGPTKPEKKKTLVFGLYYDVDTLDPAMHRRRYIESVIQQYAEPLVHRDNNMNLIPWLAESYEFIDDYTWIFKIRKGVKWHDGKELTAEDVKFTIDRILDPATKSPRASMIAEVESVEVLDKYTVRIKTKSPFALLPIMLSFQEILPKHLVETKGEKFFESPVGTGPFKFKEWVKGEKVVFERNPDYWGGTEKLPPVGPPAVDEIVFRIIPDSATRAQALKAGEIHITYKLTPEQAEDLKKDPNIVVEKVSAARTVFCAINTYKKPFDDRRVRHALNYAVDVDAIVKNVLKGYGRRIACMSFPGMIGYNPDLKPFPYDPEKAKSLLKEAGYGNGFETVIWYTEEWRKDQVEALISYLDDVGVRAKAQLLDWATVKKSLLKPEGDMWFDSWGAAELDLTGNVNSTFAREKDTYAFQYHNPEITALMKKARATLDPNERAKIYWELEKKLQWDAPAIWLWEQLDPWAWRKEVVNFRPRGDERYNLVDVDLKV